MDLVTVLGFAHNDQHEWIVTTIELDDYRAYCEKFIGRSKHHSVLLLINEYKFVNRKMAEFGFYPQSHWTFMNVLDECCRQWPDQWKTILNGGILWVL